MAAHALGACAAKFSFTKNHRDLRNDFFENLQIASFYIKELLLEIKFEIKLCYIFFFIFTKMPKTICFPYKKSNKKVSLTVSSFSACKQTKEQILYQVQP